MRATNPDHGPADARQFATTQWSLVLAAGRRSSPESAQALASLCRVYWYPLYAYIRRRGHAVHEAEDLTQAFFALLLEKNFLGDLKREKGKFRSFLLAACKHFLANEWDRSQAKKRGGAQEHFSFDFTAAERRLGHGPADPLTPEKYFERCWAITLLDHVLDRLQAECARTGKQQLFERLQGLLIGAKADQSYDAIAAELQMTAGAVKVAAHRLRRRYRELLREEIAGTTDGPEGTEDELRLLFKALGA